MMSENEDMFADSLVRILADHADSVHAALWAASLWATLDGAGFPRALATESAGGSALGWADAFSLFAAAGQAAAPVPLAESMVAHWLLDTADIASAATLLSLSAPRQPLDLSPQAAGGWPRAPRCMRTRSPTAKAASFCSALARSGSAARSCQRLPPANATFPSA